MSRTLIIGTRGSELALWQADYLQRQLKDLQVPSALHIIRTHGDRVQDRSFSNMGGTGFFTAELESALQAGEIDIAVHSHKDLPTQMPEDLVIAAVSYRADPADWLLIRPDAVDRREFFDLRPGAVVGTSSTRRQTQLLALRPDLTVIPLRGNVPTRVRSLQQGDCDAVILAGAGLERLNLPLQDVRVVRLDPRDFPPAPAQGVLAFQARKSDAATLAILASVNDSHSAHLIRAERRILANLRGGCQLPFGAFCEERDGIMYLSLSLGELGGKFPRRLRLEHPDPDVLVVEAWRRLHAPAPDSVFISRELAANSLFARACLDHAIRVHPESLLHFEDIPVEWPSTVDWVVFSSRTAVGVFSRQTPILDTRVRFGAIGEGTAKALRRLGLEVDYTFDPMDLSGSVNRFLELAGGARVLFPGAENSLRSIQQLAGHNIQAVDLPVYHNSPKREVNIPPVNLAILTSPMNAETYLGFYPERKNDRLIAIGESTAKALRKAGAWNIFEARRPSELALIEALFSA